jgi:hypothetical protein
VPPGALAGKDGAPSTPRAAPPVVRGRCWPGGAAAAKIGNRRKR